jgi:hypothetical protein
VKFAAYSVLSSVTLLATAGATAPMAGLAPQVLQGGALAILGWTVWYLLSRTFPAHTAALKEQRDAFLAHLEKRDSKSDD